MSYIRIGYPLIFVKGESEDYIFESLDDNDEPYVHDYGSCENSTLVELACKSIEEMYGKKPIARYLMKKLADRLGIKLRKKPLTEKEWFKLAGFSVKSK